MFTYLHTVYISTHCLDIYTLSTYLHTVYISTHCLHIYTLSGGCCPFQEVTLTNEGWPCGISMNPDPKREHEGVVLFSRVNLGVCRPVFFNTATASAVLLNLETLAVMARHEDRIKFNAQSLRYLDTGDRILAFRDARHPDFQIWIFETHRLELRLTVRVEGGGLTGGCQLPHQPWTMTPFVSPCQTRVSVVMRPQLSSSGDCKDEIVSFHLKAGDGVMTLEKLSRATILRHCRHPNIKKLPLPQSLMDFVRGY